MTTSNQNAQKVMAPFFNPRTAKPSLSRWLTKWFAGLQLMPIPSLLPRTKLMSAHTCLGTRRSAVGQIKKESATPGPFPAKSLTATFGDTPSLLGKTFAMRLKTFGTEQITELPSGVTRSKDISQDATRDNCFAMKLGKTQQTYVKLHRFPFVGSRKPSNESQRSDLIRYIREVSKGLENS